MTTPPVRPVHVDLVRDAPTTYTATNARGGTVEMYSGDAESDLFTPVELLLAAIAGCAATGVDVMTSRRAQPDVFEVRVDADRAKDDGGNILQQLAVTFDVRFPEGADGDRARALLDAAIETTHAKLCTVSRTIEQGAPVPMRRKGE